jgi:hypothetical protein
MQQLHGQDFCITRSLFWDYKSNHKLRFWSKDF